MGVIRMVHWRILKDTETIKTSENQCEGLGSVISIFGHKFIYCLRILLALKRQNTVVHNIFITLLVQANFCVSYPVRVISRVKCIGYIGKGVLNSHLGSNPDPYYIQNCVIKRFRCTTVLKNMLSNHIYTILQW